MKLVEIQNLKKYYPVQQGLFNKVVGHVKAVDGINFSIAKGEILGLVGETGCGKTTTGRSLLRAIEPTEGNVLFGFNPGEKIDFTQLTSRQEILKVRRHTQMIFQDPSSSLSPRMTVRDIIAEPLVAHNLASGSALDDRIHETAVRCQLKIEHLRRYPHSFSGGQRQRIGIARALAPQPDFVVCDEPVSALDVSIQAQILNLLKELQSEFQLTYLFIAHDLSVIKHISNHVAVMYVGKIVEKAPTEKIFYQPAHPYTEALLSAIPKADPDMKMEAIALPGEIPSPANVPPGCPFHTRCRYQEDLCKHEVPDLVEIDQDHFVSCHFADQLQLRGVE